MSVLILAEYNHSELNPTTLAMVTAAKMFNEPIDILVAGLDIQAVMKQAASLEGIRQVYGANHVAYQHLLAENLAALVSDLGKNYNVILAPATTFGKNVLPRVAALLDVQPISDIIRIESSDTFVRPIYAGNALAKVQSIDAKKVITVRPTAFEPAIMTQTQAPIEMIDKVFDLQLSEYIGLEATQSERPDLNSAKIIISGGRGLQDKEQFYALLEPLADKLNAAIGASRAAVDAGFVPNDYQVGQTGKIVAPQLYIAIGISGAIQHLAGMKDSKVIVAINKDEDAPIFQIADYALVGDLFTLVPELIAAL